MSLPGIKTDHAISAIDGTETEESDAQGDPDRAIQSDAADRGGRIAVERRPISSEHEGDSQLAAELEGLRAQVLVFGLFTHALLEKIARLEAEREVHDQAEAEVQRARRIEHERGITLDRLGAEVFPGKPYITPTELVRRNGTRYSQSHLFGAIQRGDIPARKLAGKVVLYVDGVETVLAREAEALNDPSSRRQPGPRRSRFPRGDGEDSKT